MLQKFKNRKVAAIWAFAGVVPLALPGFTETHLAGLHRFYLREYGWGFLYLFFGLFTPIPWIAGVLEGVWYLVQDEPEFNRHFNQGVSVEDGAMAYGRSEGSPGTVSLATPTPTPTPTIVVKSVSPVVKTAEAVRELDQLRQDGLISEREFEQKRRQLIDRIR